MNVSLNVPFNCPDNLYQPLISALNLQDNVCQVYKLRLEWNAEAVARAKEFVLAAIKKSDFSKGLEFVITFTNSNQTKLMEFAYIQYWIENNSLVYFTGECFHDLKKALCEEDALEIYDRVEKTLEQKKLNSSSQLKLNSTMPKIHKLIAQMKFQEFANILDNQPTKYRICIKSIEETGELLDNVIVHKKGYPFKIIFEFLDRGLIKIRTTRWKRKVILIIRSFAEQTRSVMDFMDIMLEKRNLKILHRDVVIFNKIKIDFVKELENFLLKKDD